MPAAIACLTGKVLSELILCSYQIHDDHCTFSLLPEVVVSKVAG
jgi:hypothetical protein